MATRKLEVVITGNTKAAQRSIGDLESRTSTFGSKMSQVGSKVGRSFSSMGAVAVKALKGIAIGAAATGIAVTAALASTIPAASSQAEAISKVEQVFGSASAAVMTWASTSADAFGQSKTQALEAAGTYGNLFQSFGLGREAAQTMSIGLVELASDLASFNNTSVADALAALQSGVSGETEPLKRYGIALNEAGLKAEALSLGLVKADVSAAKVEAATIAQEKAVAAVAAATKKYGADSVEAREAQSKLRLSSENLAKVMKGAVPAALTPAQKAQAAYSLIIKASTLAQGDFARTSDGLANKQRILTAKFEDMKARIGTGLLPIVLKLAEAGEKYLLPVLTEAAGAVRSFFAAFNDPSGGVTSGGFAGAIENLGIKARSVFESLKTGFGEVVGGVRAFVSAFKDGSDDITSSGFAGWLEALGVHARNAFDAIARNWDTVRNAIVTGATAVWGALVKVYDAVRPVVQALARFVQNNPGPVLTGLAVIIGGALVGALYSMAAAAIAAFAPVYAVIAAVALVAGGLVWAYQNVDGFREAVDKAAAFLTGTVVPAFQTFAAWIGEHLPAAIAAAQEAFTSMSIIVGAIFSQIRDSVSSGVAAVQMIWRNFGENILLAARGVWGNIRQIIGGQLDIIGGLFKTITSLIQGDWGQAWEGIKQIVHGALNVVLGIVKNAGELLRLAATVTMEILNSAWSAAWEKIKETPRLAWEGIQNLFAWGSQWLVDQVTALPGRISTAASGMFNGLKEAFRSALNWIIDKWNGLELKIPGYDPPGPGPKFDGFSLNTPDIPRFHSGGVIPGRVGTEVPIIAQAGERVLSIPQAKAMSSSRGGSSLGGNTYQISVTESRDAKATAREVVAEINRQTRMGKSPLVGV